MTSVWEPFKGSPLKDTACRKCGHSVDMFHNRTTGKCTAIIGWKGRRRAVVCPCKGPVSKFEISR